MNDLLGDPIKVGQEVEAKRGTIPKGYAGFGPDSGPEGETCQTCTHLVRRKLSKTYLKCGLMQHAWTRVQTSARSPRRARNGRIKSEPHSKVRSE